MCQSVFVGIADHMRNTREGRDFSRRALGVAAGHNNFAVWVLAPDATNGGPGVLFGGRGNGAGVQDHKVGTGWGFGSIQALLPELLLYSGTVGLSGPTAEIFYVKAGHAPILAYIHLRCGAGTHCHL